MTFQVGSGPREAGEKSVGREGILSKTFCYFYLFLYFSHLCSQAHKRVQQKNYRFRKQFCIKYDPC